MNHKNFNEFHLLNEDYVSGYNYFNQLQTNPTNHLLLANVISFCL